MRKCQYQCRWLYFNGEYCGKRCVFEHCKQHRAQIKRVLSSLRHVGAVVGELDRTPTCAGRVGQAGFTNTLTYDSSAHCLH